MPAGFEPRGRERRYPNGERMPDDADPLKAGGEEAASAFNAYRKPKNCGSSPGFVIAMVLIGLGVVFLLNNIGFVHIRIFDIWRYWPLILILSGVTKLASARGPLGQMLGGLLIGLGALFLLANLGLIHLSIVVIWPLVLIGVGISLLLRGAARSRAPLSAEFPGRPTASSDFGEADSVLRDWALFGGVKRVIDSQNFQGGELVSIFGGIEVDLRRASIAPGGAPVVIDANAAFGGINIKVPDTWRVAVRGTAIFGGYEDKTLRPRQPDTLAPFLVITGYAAFGGVVVE